MEGTNSRVVTLSVLFLLGLALCSASRSLQGSHETGGTGAGGSGIYTKQLDLDVGGNVGVSVNGTNVLGPVIGNLKPILSPVIKSPPIAPIVAPIAEPIVAPVAEPIVAPIIPPVILPIAPTAGEPIAV